ncbi:MAG TPA: amino acid adenylation domain-containing protein [Pyrinomonadaceae bacterium]|nr:amino acid adenylation domain-containing protein [Pyrinomonadaceae bacterium]
MAVETKSPQSPPEVDLEDLYQLSPMQLGMLFHTLEAPESGVYLEQSVFTIEGALDVVSFERAWQTVINRHSILRTAFLWQNLDSPVQVVHRHVDIAIEKHDWRGKSVEIQNQTLDEYLSTDRNRGFDVEKAPLIRLALFQTSDNTHKFVFSRHHLILDRWSRAIINKEVFAYYDAFTRNEELLLEDPRPYGDYISWIAAQDQDAAEHYWRENLKGLSSPTRVETQDQREDVSEYHDKRIQLSQSQTTELKSFARQNKLTLSTIVQAAWVILLARYSGKEDVLFGVTVSGRTPALAGVESMVGLFINTLPLRTRVRFDSPVIDWLQALQHQQLELQTYEYCSLLDIHRWSEIPPGEPLFRSLLVFENLPVASRHERDDSIVIRGDRSYGSATGYPLTLMATPGSTLHLQLVYDPARFDPETVERMLLHLRTIVEEIIARPDQKLGRMRMLTAAEEALLDEWNNTSTAYPNVCVYQLIERQAALRPDAIAVEMDSEQLRYAELNARANQLARHLRAMGVGPETLVGVFLRRSVQMVVALLAIHKAGGAYLPLDPSFPEKRLSYMVQNAELKVLLTETSLADALPPSTARIINVDNDFARHSSEDLVPNVTSENLAYVIYTSGSTGNPKGVQIEHRGFTNFILSMQREPGITPDDVVLAITTLSFDPAGLELFLPLITGARFVIADSETAGDGFQLREKLATSGATVLQATPTTWRMLIDAGWRARKGLKALCGGEALSSDLAGELMARGATLWNVYGPTEATVWPMTCRIEPRGSISIGRPIANIRVYILDKLGNRVPVGVAGELHMAGDGLARGYLNLPELTAGSFIPDTFGSDANQRLYKTGDLGRYLLDGNIEYLGRLDHQVKIRGFRIELGEIESVLRQHPAIHKCVVVAREDSRGEQQLVAYVVRAGGAHTTAAELRAFLSDRLPSYMVPAAMVELDDLPLTPTGKVDRRALPAPDYRPQAEDTVSPRSQLEELLLGIWTQVLKTPDIGINHNFFELGGHSLLAVSVVSRTRAALNVDLKVRHLFEAPTIAALAHKINQLSGVQPLPPIKKVRRDRELPVSFAQERMWFLNQLEKDSPFYNVPGAFKLTGPLDVSSLQKAFEQITLRHEAFRTTFSVVDGRPVQVIGEATSVRFSTCTLEGLAPAAVEGKIQRLGYEEAREPFDLERGPLLRAKVVRLSETEHVVFTTAHHIVSDGWSLGILIRELAALYENLTSQTSTPLPELSIQYADYAVWQRDWLEKELLDRQLSYWKKQLQGVPTVLDLPTDRPRSLVQTFNGARYSVQLSQKTTEALKELSRREGATLFMTILAAYETLLFRYTGQENIIVGTPVAGRSSAEIENLIGFFVNTLPLKTSLSGNLTFEELLAGIRETALDAYANQDLPFEQLVEAMQPERDLSRTPLFQVMFAFQNAPREVFRASGLTFERRRIENHTSKFDLTLFATEAAEKLYFTFEYNTDLFERARIERMMGHFEVLIEAIVAEPQKRIGELPLLTPSEREQLLVEWNRTAAAYPEKQSIQQLFEEQVARTPTAVAVSDGKQSLTYEQLEQHANQLARRLRRGGVGAESLVAVCLERSTELVVALLGILKAGGAYVPLDPSYPQPRLQFMLEDSAAEVVLTEQHLAARLPHIKGKQICIDQEREQLAQESTERLRAESLPESLAYVIYTSGSTGRPKGVAIEHHSTVTMLQWAQTVYSPEDLAAVLASTSICFDLSVFELFLPLSVGGTAVIAEDALQLASAEWKQELTLINTVPSAIAELLRLKGIPESVRVVNLAGEPLPQTLVQQLYEQPTIERVYDLYGPSEDTTYSTYALRSATEAATIGRPIANTQVYLLDAWLQPVPIGVPGELYLGGAGLARGYLKRPELTAEKFIANPFGAEGTRLYKTGDVARYQEDGKLQYLGRSDQQVKLRGYRIELGEIEAAINEHPDVRESVVVLHGDGLSDNRIVAHVVLENQPRSDESGQAQRLHQWQAVWDETYRQKTSPSNPRFNTIGWNSSYTGEPIPEEEMREWASGVVQRILALNPRRVLEIGCGTGLVLFQVAPKCRFYCGTDVSSHALRYLEQQFGPGEFDNVKLLQRTADDLSDLDAEKFDVIILNSVVQYFPSIDYLVRVLRGILDVAAPDAAIFLGDIRSLSLLRLLHTDVQVCNAPAGLTIQDVQTTIEKQMALEKELVIDPAFFSALQQLLPGIARVEIQLKRGRHENELTKFRYDVTLHLGKRELSKADSQTADWGTDVTTTDDLRHLLSSSNPELLTVRGVPNARLNASLRRMEFLASQPSTMRIGEFRKLQNDPGREGIDPEDLWALDKEFPYSVEITWSETGTNDSFDVLLKRRDVHLNAVSEEVSRHRESNWRRFANSPSHAEPARDLLPMLRGFLAQRLPEHMIPWMIAELKEVPLTANGKIDRLAISRLGVTKRRIAGTTFAPPKTRTESILAEIWAEVLRLERVGIEDNFFEIGGHSLLATQVISRVRERLGADLPLRRIFESPTVSGLAQGLEQQLRSHTATELPITKSAGIKPAVSPEEIDRLSEDEIDSLLYQVLAEADREI